MAKFSFLHTLQTTLIAGVVCFSLSACQQQGETDAHSPMCANHVINLVMNNQTMITEVACTMQQKATGLMYRKDLPQNSGMIFVYDKPIDLHFWMKNTYIPLSIAFVDAQWKITDIHEMKAFDESITSSEKPAQYAIEANPGWFEKNNIHPGDTVYMQPTMQPGQTH